MKEESKIASPRPRNTVTISSIVKSEGHKKKIATNYVGDEVLKRLGVSSEERQDPISTLKKFMQEVRADSQEKYRSLQREIEFLAQKCQQQQQQMKEEEEKKTKGPAQSATKSCEAVLAEYLWEVGGKVTERFMMVLIIFVRLYRDCLNEYGWELARRSGELPAEEGKRDFAGLPTAEHIPEACNDFIRHFLPNESPSFDKYLAIELTRHMCDWVHSHKYTHKMISLL